MGWRNSDENGLAAKIKLAKAQIDNGVYDKSLTPEKVIEIRGDFSGTLGESNAEQKMFQIFKLSGKKRKWVDPGQTSLYLIESFVRAGALEIRNGKVRITLACLVYLSRHRFAGTCATSHS